jgi:predicted AlkP superfamily phosphohydrolase/phosphomutase
MKKTHLLAGAFCAALLAAAYFGFGGDGMAPEGRYSRVVLVGIDGMDPAVMSKLMAEGGLPNFKRLADAGTFIRLNTSLPPHSPVAWTSIATGRNPGKHGIFDFIIRDPKTYTPLLSLSKVSGGLSGTEYGSYVSADPFWRITSNAGVPTTVIRWPVTFPPEGVRGNMLSGLGVPDIRGFLGGYAYYTSADDGKSDKASNRFVRVNVTGGAVDTEVWGPKTAKGGAVVDVSAPLGVKLSADGKSAVISVDGADYPVESGGWSGWVRAKFKVGMFKSVYGTFRAYLLGTDPFRMYVTAIQIDPENPVVPISKPDGYSAELAREIGPYYTLGMPEETDGYVEDRLSKGAFLAQIGQIEGEREAMFWEGFNASPKGVYAFVYDSSDRLQHVSWAWKAMGGGQLEVDDAVVEYYLHKDRFLGELLDRIDAGTLLLVISDHGFTSFERSVSMNRWLVENGYMTLREEPPAGEDGALFEYVDWGKTKAYSLGFNSVYVNSKGREGQGIVEDGDVVAAEIASRLEGLIDPKNGKNAVKKAYLGKEIYQGPKSGEAPDIIVGFNPGYRMAWQTAVGGLTPQVFDDNTKRWNGDHLIDPSFVPGCLFTNAKLKASSASQLDIAATVLDAEGVAVPQDMDGRSLL